MRRKSCGKKMLQGKSHNLHNFYFRNNIIFHNLHFFLPAPYTLRVLIDVPLLINVLIFFAPPLPTSYSMPPSPRCLLFFQICLSQLTDMHARYQILLIFLIFLIVIWGYFLYSKVRQT